MACRISHLHFGTERSASRPSDKSLETQLLTECSPFLKERLFGLSNPQGNHGESVKEAHFHLDNTPVSTSAPTPTVFPSTELFVALRWLSLTL